VQNRRIQNPELHKLTRNITVLKQNPLYSKDKLKEPPLFFSIICSITKRMKQFPQFCSPKWREAFRKTDAFPVAGKQFPIKTQKIPSSQFPQILQIWVLTT